MRKRALSMANHIPLKTLLILCIAISLLFAASLAAAFGLSIRIGEEELRRSQRQLLELEYRDALDSAVGRIVDATYSLAARDVLVEYTLGNRGKKVQTQGLARTLLNDAVEFIPEIDHLFLYLKTGELISNTSGSGLDVVTYQQISAVLSRCRSEDYREIRYLIPPDMDGKGSSILTVVVPFSSWEVAGKDVQAWFIASCTTESLIGSMSHRDKEFLIYAGDRLLYGNPAPDAESYLKVNCTGSDLWIHVPYTVNQAAGGADPGLVVGAALLVFLLSEILLLVCMYFCLVIPIQDLVSQMQEIGPESPHLHTEAVSRSEIGRLVAGINGMLLNVDRLNRECIQQEVRLVALENAHLQARNLFLQAQINPHFLYNALECINGMLANGNHRDVPAVVGSLAQLYRYCTGVDSVSLEEEMEIIRRYVDMMNVMRDSAHRLEIDIPASVLEMEIPRMIVQPVVENAIQHGFSNPLRKEGRIRITAYLKDGRLTMTVSDDGHGMSAQDLDQLNREMQSEAGKSRRVGITNVNRRLKLLYGKSSGVMLYVNTSGGVDTIIAINYPAEQSEKPTK